MNGLVKIMNNIKYLYFEIEYLIGDNATKPSIINENVLLIKPETNSSGVWGFTNMSERAGGKSFVVIEQYWIDLDKFKDENHKVYAKMRIHVDDVLRRISLKLNLKII